MKNISIKRISNLPKLPNGRDMELVDLYMYVEDAGDNEKASKNSKWPKIAIKLDKGFEKGDLCFEDFEDLGDLIFLDEDTNATDD
ncbi:hypothetical protein E3N88_18192 [Mikania micrantha]|uniref:ARID domain-containing protein n=1 Tax=Mikania micrantha TaxID=192012 RepID=A0A5N6NU66_9ASTR|nr:hypothetical protein E3N88_18192 [Mikania micrantha]